MTKSDQTAAVVEAVLKSFGRIDHLVNNAGITRDNLFLRMKEEEWDAVIGRQPQGRLQLDQGRHPADDLRPATAGSSTCPRSPALMGNAGQTNYAASKAGLIGFSKSLARETASRNVTVNCVAPGLHRHGR